MLALRPLRPPEAKEEELLASTALISEAIEFPARRKHFNQFYSDNHCAHRNREHMRILCRALLSVTLSFCISPPGANITTQHQYLPSEVAIPREEEPAN